MKPAEMLYQMCHQVLTKVDIKAIAKARGFSAHEAGSPATLETFFLSDIGVATAMSTLTETEVALLHLLALGDKAIDIPLFGHAYGTVNTNQYYGSFNQRYQATLKMVRTNLIRKGLLLQAEIKDANAKSKMERWRFYFPQEFVRFLPPLFATPLMFDDGGDYRPEVLRKKVLNWADGEPDSPLPPYAAQKYAVTIDDGALNIGKRPFRVDTLLGWQQASWEAAVPREKQQYWVRKPFESIPWLKATLYILGQLPDQAWVSSEQLAVPLKVFTDEDLNWEEVCLHGWYWGCLARRKQGQTMFYRLAPQETASFAIDNKLDMRNYLDPPQNKPLIVNLETIPYTMLEQLAKIADLKVSTSGTKYPHASPNLIKLGRRFDVMREQPLLTWLAEHAPEFQQAFEQVRKNWGKQIVHVNLLVARIQDLGLKVQLEKAFADSQQVIFLPNDYIAFPRNLLPTIERAVTKTGHVIKRVSADV